VDGDRLITFWDLNDVSNQGPGKITDLNGTGYIDGGDVIRPVAAGGWADGQDDGRNGFTDDLIGWDFAENDNDPIDTHGHGTATFGIIGAVGNNGAGVAGVNWRIQIMPVRVFPADTLFAHLPAAIYTAAPRVFPQNRGRGEETQTV
jgi:subtilisin family serine protease